MSNILMWILIILGIAVIGYLLVQLVAIVATVALSVFCLIKMWKGVEENG